MNKKFSGFISNGRLILHDRQGFNDTVSHSRDMDVVVTIEKKRVKRSLDANAYYRGVAVVLITEALIELGHDVTTREVHEFLKAKFNTKEIVNKMTGQVEMMPVSTASLNSSEFNEYLQKIIIWAAEFLGVVIPEPNSQTALDF